MYAKSPAPTTAVTPRLFHVTGPFFSPGAGLPSTTLTLLKFLTEKLDNPLWLIGYKAKAVFSPITRHNQFSVTCFTLL